MTGRPRKMLANSNKNLTKEEIAIRQESEEKMSEFPTLPETPPKFLDEIGKREYRRIRNSLEMLPIADLDLAQVIAYCSFYSDFVKAIEIIERDGLVIDGKVNPAFNAKDKAQGRLQSVASKLGMTIDSRMKIVTPSVEKEVDEFDEFY